MITTNKCINCGNFMHIHYVYFCPNCCEPKLLVEDGVLDAIKLKIWLNTHQEGFGDIFWKTIDDRVRNDSLIRYSIEEPKEDEYFEIEFLVSKMIYDNFKDLNVRFLEFSW